MSQTFDVAVVGHLCLDIIPHFKAGDISVSQLLVPGKLVNVGNAVLSTGGAASNTGLALHRLGFDARIVGKVGDDAFGRIVMDILGTYGADITSDMVVGQGEGTSYSVVINPPGIDRIFLHSSGVNDSFGHADVSDDILSRARIVHFGYPPLMRRFYSDGGHELRTLMLRAKKHGVATSLDMARPDPDGDSGKVDWRRYLEHVLPVVDFFLPSIDELVFMLDPARFRELIEQAGDGNPASFMPLEEIGGYADALLGMGAAVVGFKLGDRGFYIKSSRSGERFESLHVLSPGAIPAWLGVELCIPCREVTVVGTTGSGDCTIAGFLGAVIKGMTPECAAVMAVSVGGASVEAREATAGIPAWDDVCERIDKGWPLRAGNDIPGGWKQLPSGAFTRL